MTRARGAEENPARVPPSPNYSTTTALLARGITSARDITAIGKTRFMRDRSCRRHQHQRGRCDVPQGGKHYHRSHGAGRRAAGHRAGRPIAAINSGDLTTALAKATADFPNLKSLFKGVDTCACEHCRSVYGPAAYLVELLEFIDKRSVTDLTVTPPVTTNAAQDVLFARRPDLGDIDLSCANANTPVPYIDLVNELLEAQVAPDAGSVTAGRWPPGPIR